MSIELLKARLAARQDEFARLKVTVLCGGASAEREVSLNSGKAVADAFAAAGINARLLEVGQDNLSFQLGGGGQKALNVHEEIQSGNAPVPVAGAALLADIRKSDAVFTTMHGTFGEDGVWQGLLELLNVPYVSADVRGSALAMDKIVTKRLFESLGVPTPRYWVKHKGCRVEISSGISNLVAKPPSEGSSVGIRMVDNNDGGMAAIDELNQAYDPLLIEERIEGKEITAAVIGDNANPVCLPLVEIRPKDEFYSYQAKYTSGGSNYFCPAELDPATAAKVVEQAALIYREFGLEPYARIDCLVDECREPWFLEANTLPGFTPLSLLPMAAKEAGVSFEELVQILIMLALERHERKGGRDA